MRQTRYIFLLAMMLVSIIARGQFNPDNPPEPSPTYKLTVLADPAEGGTVTGGGLYKEGVSVTVKATAASVEWEFVNWTNSAGTAVSTKSSYTYKMTDAPETLTAHFRHVETSLLTLQSSPSSMFKAKTTQYKVGTALNVTCSTYSDYTFQHWLDQTGAIVSTERSFTYTTTSDDQVLTARYKFTPGSPAEPSETKAKHRVYFTASPSGAGTFSETSGMQVSEGSSFSVTARNATSYAFVNWTDKDGRELSTEPTYRGTMGTDDMRLTANFRFAPGNPADPGTSSAAHYTLYMPTVQVVKGETILLPVYLENTGDVASLTFAITLPEGVEAQASAISITSRTSGYTPVASQSGQTLTVSLADGTQISDHNGVVVQIPVVASDNCVDGSYTVAFSNAAVVLTDGTQKNVTSRQGTLSITTPAEGDVQAQFSVDRYMNRAQFTNMTTGDARTFLWDFGDGTTSRETSPLHVYGNPGTYTVRLTASTTTKESTVEQAIIINAPSTWTANGDYTLDANGTGVRNFVSAEEMVSLLGLCTVTGNIAVAVADGRYTIDATDAATRLKMASLTASLASNDSKLRLVASGSVAAVNASINITVREGDDSLDATMEWLKHVQTEGVLITVNGVDVSQLVLQISLDKAEYNEGETMHLTARVLQRLDVGDLTLSFVIDQPKRFRLPQSYTFPAGETVATIDIPVLQDNIPTNEATIELKATTAYYGESSVIFVLNDDDVPAISLSLTTETVSEGAGANAIYGTVTRQGAKNSKITLRLSDDSDGVLYYTSPITMPEGTEEVRFPIGIKNNDMVDGDRDFEFTAEIYLTDCDCGATASNIQTKVTKTIHVLDDDGATLTITADKTTILEGDGIGTVLTISRNDNLTTALMVRLEASVNDVTYPASITIPAGQKSATATLTANANSTTEGNRTITVKATAEGFSAGVAWLLISDQTLPDLCLDNPALPTGTIRAGESYTLTLPVANIGSATMPAGSIIEVKVNNETRERVTIDEDIAPGETKTITVEMSSENVPGQYTLSIMLNSNQHANELQYMNNSATATFTVTTVYSYDISTDKAAYNIGDVVTLSGTVHGLDGSLATGIAIEPYIVYAGRRTALSATSGTDGRFTATYTIADGMGGDYSFGVCVPGEGLTTSQGAFSVYGMIRTQNAYIKNNLFVGEPYSGVIELKNQSSLTLHNIAATVSDPTGQYTVTASPISELAGNGTARLAYTITGNAVSTSSTWEEVALHLTSTEGATLDIVTYNYTRTHSATLTINETSISTSVNKATPRNYPIILSNTGQGETGTITVSLPSNMGSFVTLLSPSSIPSLQSGDSTTVVLRFDGIGYDINAVQSGRIAINCENGDGRTVDFRVKVVSNEKGNLKVLVEDENTIYGTASGEHPYVANATVQLSDYNTGAIVATANTAAEGIVQIDNIAEGYYRLLVTADKHDSYRQNVLVSPGETTEHTATISYQAVNVSWRVEETTVEDVYEIQTSLTYETQVPVPVVILSIPDEIALAQMRSGESLLFNCELTNKGLIPAEKVHIEMPDNMRGYTFTPLVQSRDFTIASGATYTVPVLVQCESDGTFTPASLAPGQLRIDGGYQWQCGSYTKYGTVVDFAKTGQEMQKWTSTVGSSTSSSGGGNGGSSVEGGPLGKPTTGGSSSATTSGSTTNVDIIKSISCTTTEVNGVPVNSCAYVKLKFDQRLVLTRQAFRGTLTIENSTSQSLANISLNITATDPTGKIATAREMDMKVESIAGFDGSLDGEWSLAAGQTGVATILFVPTKYAAPEETTTYSFGGTLYFDDGSGVQARGLYPVELQVKPSPELDLTYFIQRDVYGDNLLTTEVVEPTVPAEFTVLVRNKGYGDATNVRMLTRQPQIVENDGNTPIDFTVVGSSLNGKDLAMALNSDIATSFGDIVAGTSSYATWYLACNLLGHFADYDATYTHVSSYGNDDLSLIDQVAVHQLVHSVNATNADGSTCRAWVVNDIADAQSLPDHIYLANGTDEDVAALVDATEVQPLGDGKYSITVAASAQGWFYTKIENPAGANSRVASISDVTGRKLDTANYWATQYAMTDGNLPVAENALHIVDYASTSGTHTYVVEVVEDTSGDGTLTQTVELPAGWSWLGSNVLRGPLVESVFGSNLVELRTSSQTIINDPSWGYFGDTDLMLSSDTGNGHFRVNLKAGQTITLSGIENDCPAWTNLVPRWNWVNNPFVGRLVLNDHPDFWADLCEGDMLKSKDGSFSIYEDGEWVGLLDELQPSLGYALHTSTDAQRIDFNRNSITASMPDSKHLHIRKAPSGLWDYDGSRFPDNMSIIALIDGLDNPENYSVGTFVGDECRGEGKFVKNKWYIFAHGESGDEVSFKLMYIPTREICDMDGTLAFAASAGTSSQPVVLHAPDNIVTNIIELAGVDSRIRIYNISGVEVTSRQDHLAPGVYVIKRGKVTKRVVAK